MQRFTKRTIGLGVIAVVMAAGAVAAQGRTPQPVQDKVEHLFPGRSPKIVPERRGDEMVFEAIRGTQLEVVMDRHGDVQEVEARVPRGVVPEAVRDAARERFGRKAQGVEAEVIVRNGDQLLYELEAQVSGGERELYLEPDGTVVEDSAK